MAPERTRYEIESIIVKPDALRKLGTHDDIDPDMDTIALVEYRDTKPEATKRAKAIYRRDVIKLNRSCWNVVTIQKQRYMQPYEEYPHVWEWEPIEDMEEIR